MDEGGRQRLLAAVGPSLQELWVNLPNERPFTTQDEHSGQYAVEYREISLGHILTLFIRRRRRRRVART